MNTIKAMLMMHENLQWIDGSWSHRWVPREYKNKNQTKGTGGISAKDPSKVKLVNEKSPRIL